MSVDYSNFADCPMQWDSFEGFKTWQRKHLESFNYPDKPEHYINVDTFKENKGINIYKAGIMLRKPKEGETLTLLDKNTFDPIKRTYEKNELVARGILVILDNKKIVGWKLSPTIITQV